MNTIFFVLVPLLFSYIQVIKNLALARLVFDCDYYLKFSKENSLKNSAIIGGVKNNNVKNAHGILVIFVLAFLVNRKAKNNPKGTVIYHNQLTHKK
ncbi:hypothetical protein XBFFL1_2440010 [Xenorhabdus bovienii str. feltiae Florida]|nr:hypothetical protein XBFFL1_2440010 [Xenorhabdus bovienii str. feltiae Florida]